MRDIKFRAWDKWDNKMEFPNGSFLDVPRRIAGNWKEFLILMQYTGLKDKNGLKEIYEGDIIDVEGNIKGNIYENNKEATDFVIQGFGTKDWCATYKEAMERGCKNSE